MSGFKNAPVPVKVMAVAILLYMFLFAVDSMGYSFTGLADLKRDNINNMAPFEIDQSRGFNAVLRLKIKCMGY